MSSPVPRCTLLAFSAILCFGQASTELEITAKIVLEDGAPLKSAPLISLGLVSQGYPCAGKEFFLGGTLRLRVPSVSVAGERLTSCGVSIRLTGYREFNGQVQDGAVIILRRIGPNEDSTVSIVSLNAPANAKKEYGSGEGAASKKKWQQAEGHFRAAVSLYPQYATAWSELGQVLQEQSRLGEAMEAFTKAHEADPKYIKPLVQLASASRLQQHWGDEMRFSEEAIELHPVEFPAAYYYHAEATFQAGKIEEAERLTREAVELDPGITCPESLVLLGAIFEKQGNPRDAVTEYKNYLKLAPKGPQAPQAKEALARLKQSS